MYVCMYVCIYFSKSKQHTVPFFLKSNCLPLPSLFFRDCSYLLYDINTQTAPVSILNQFVKTSQIHNYRTRSVTSDSFSVKLSRTDKMYSIYCIVVSSPLFSPSIDKPGTFNMSSAPPASISLRSYFAGGKVM